MKDFKTKLSAVMFTDIVEYSLISSRNFRLGVKIAKENSEINSKYIKEFNGVLQKEMGDGTLSYFDSSVDAVKCGIKIMKEVITLNKERKLKWHLRIGIHIGEVHFVNGDLLGDTVNVASRIENFADPDSILISQDVFKIVKRNIVLSTLKLGKTELKNIEEKHILYKILGEATGAKKYRSSKKNKLIISTLVILLFTFLIFVVSSIFPYKFYSIFKDLNPSKYVVNENTSEIIFYNKNDKFLWSKKIIENIKGNDKEHIVITDLENDGINEVIFAYHTLEDTTNIALVSCLNYNGNKIWETTFSKKVYKFSQYYKVRQIKCDDLDNDGNQELIILFNQVEYWPSFLTVLDKNGKYLYQVLNGGYLISIAVKDIDNDGIKDIFSGGVNNVASKDISSILMYINGNRIFNNNGLWKEQVCLAPIQDNLQTVDGYFYPQKTIFNLLRFGEIWKDDICDITFFDEYLRARVYFKREKDNSIYSYAFYLNYSFNEWEVILHHNYDNFIIQFIEEFPILDENIKKYYNERYSYPIRLKYWNFETMQIDSLFTGIIN